MPRLLEVRNLATHFATRDGVVKAVNGISYHVDEGETLGIVGESGCGKSVGGLSIMRLVPEPPGRIVDGEVLFRGQDLLKLSDADMRRVRGGEIAMVFQDPFTSLNPVLTVGFQITEALCLQRAMNGKSAQNRAVELLRLVGIPDPETRMKEYPHQFSGGMRQRVMIAIALSREPRLLIADEPTTALDVTVQQQIIDLVKRLQSQLGLAVIWITHDLGVVASVAKRVIVMYAGSIVEEASTIDLFASPRHPYTIGLLESLPAPHDQRGKKLSSIPGQPPDLTMLTGGCPFADRCDYVEERCRKEHPPPEAVGSGHGVACWQRDKTEGVWSPDVH